MAYQVDARAVAVKSIGCRTNQEEMSNLSGILTKQGYHVVDKVADASIIVVNTCSVTAATESKTRRLLQTLAAEAPKARILVTGCLAQQQPEELEKIKGVAWVVGNGCKQQIDSILRIDQPGIFISSLQAAAKEPLDVNQVLMSPDEPSRFRTRFSVKIQEGCDFRCSYCIVPQLRGPSRSAPLAMIVKQCTRAIEAGYKEIVLTGTHIGQFNDRDGHRLTDIIDNLLSIDGEYRIRLSSLDPRDCSDALMAGIGASDRLCKHLHASLQSCSGAVLKAMNRPEKATEACIDRLIRFRDKYPLAGLGADIIVGFPGETDRMFDETCREIERIGLSYAHVFRFSARPGTPATGYKGQVGESVKTARSVHLRKIISRSRDQFLQRLRYSSQRIIVESCSPARGLTSNFIHVEIPECVVEHNTWLDVTITGPPSRGKYCPAQPVLSKVA